MRLCPEPTLGRNPSTRELRGAAAKPGRVIRNSAAFLADLYDAWNNPDKAAEWRAKLPEEQEAVASDPPASPT